MSVDEKLLDSQSGPKEDKSAETAGALREAQNSGGDDDQGPEGGDASSTKMAAKRTRTKRLRKNSQEDRKSISFAYSQRLKLNIYNLVTSWGTSFFYIVYHWFQSKLGNKRKYVKLGSEWMDTPGMTEKQRDEIGSNFAPWESCGFAALAMGCLIALFLAFVPFILMGYFLADPVGFSRSFYSFVLHILKFIFVDTVSNIL